MTSLSVKSRVFVFAASFILTCSGAFADVDPSSVSSDDADRSGSALGQFQAESAPAPLMPFPGALPPNTVPANAVPAAQQADAAAVQAGQSSGDFPKVM